jgi:uncharacterized pyridoxal phosphate-dependent enzyme
MKRRDLLRGISVLPVAGGMVAGSFVPAGATAAPARDYFKELGLRTFINAAGNYTSMTASLMPPEVIQAIQSSALKYALLDDVQDKVGEKIAALCHAEAAMVTAGCWSALVLGMAGVLTGMDNKKVAQLPFLEGTGMKSEVIMLKNHANGYHRALTNAGVSIITVDNRVELEKAISDKTALLWYLNREAPDSTIQHKEFVEIARQHKIPSMIDIAADVPPVENLWKFNDMGFDLVCISGGKAMLGPQSAGILMGKKDLIAAARLSAPPRSGIGRGQKVNKEEIIGMYAALERYIKHDHAKDWKMWEDRVEVVKQAVKSIKGVTTETIVPPVANHNPSLKIAWDPSIIKLTKTEMGDRLRAGDPSVEVIAWEDDSSIRITTFMLQPGQDKIVARRIREELMKATT